MILWGQKHWIWPVALSTLTLVATDVTGMPPPQTFGKGIPNFPFSSEEQVLFE